MILKKFVKEKKKILKKFLFEEVLKIMDDTLKTCILGSVNQVKKHVRT